MGRALDVTLPSASPQPAPAQAGLRAEKQDEEALQGNVPGKLYLTRFITVLPFIVYMAGGGGNISPSPFATGTHHNAGQAAAEHWLAGEPQGQLFCTQSRDMTTTCKERPGLFSLAPLQQAVFNNHGYARHLNQQAGEEGAKSNM